MVKLWWTSDWTRGGLEKKRINNNKRIWKSKTGQAGMKERAREEEWKRERWSRWEKYGQLLSLSSLRIFFFWLSGHLYVWRVTCMWMCDRMRQETITHIDFSSSSFLFSSLFACRIHIILIQYAFAYATAAVFGELATNDRWNTHTSPITQ